MISSILLAANIVVEQEVIVTPIQSRMKGRGLGAIFIGGPL